MLRVNAEHRGTEAAAVVEWNDEPIPVFLHQPVHKMNLGADGPFRTGGRLRQTFDDVFGRPAVIRKLNNLEPAFRVSNNPNSRMPRTDLPDMQRQKPLMHGAVAFPENDPAVVEHLFRVAAEFLIRVPDWHFLQPQAEGITGIAAEMLIRKEQNAIAPLQGPAHH